MDMDTGAVPGESGVPDDSLSVIFLQVRNCCSFFRMRSGVGD